MLAVDQNGRRLDPKVGNDLPRSSNRSLLINDPARYRTERSDVDIPESNLFVMAHSTMGHALSPLITVVGSDAHQSRRSDRFPPSNLIDQWRSGDASRSSRVSRVQSRHFVQMHRNRRKCGFAAEIDLRFCGTTSRVQHEE